MKRILIGLKTIVVLLLVVTIASAQEVKDPNPPANINDAPVSVNATGGPDAFGYTYRDQNEPGCTFDFIDISATGTFIVDGDDTSSGPVALGAPINIYGVNFTELNMAANGYITTDPNDTGPDLSNDCPLPAIPSTPAGTNGARLYPLHDDLDLESGIGAGYVEYFEICPRAGDTPGCELEDCTIFYYDNVAHFPGGGAAPTWDMEVILYHQSNNIVYQIGSGNPEMGSGSTTGLQDFSPPTTELTYACNTPGSVPDNTAVCIYHPSPNCLVERAVPTLSEWGLIAMAGILGVIGLFAIRRRKAAA